MSRDWEAKPIASWHEGLQYLQRIHSSVLKVAVMQIRAISPMELCRRTLGQLGLPQIMANPLVAASFQASLREEVRDQRDLLNIWARKEAA